MLDARDVHHVEFVVQGLLLKVTKPGIRDLLEGSITEYFEQRFVINSNDQVTAAQYKESGFIKGISSLCTLQLQRQANVKWGSCPGPYLWGSAGLCSTLIPCTVLVGWLVD